MPCCLTGLLCQVKFVFAFCHAICHWTSLSDSQIKCTCDWTFSGELATPAQVSTRRYKGRAVKMVTSVVGRSVASVCTLPILFTVCMPEYTRPKMVCLLSSHGVGASVMKNCEAAAMGSSKAIRPEKCTRIPSFHSDELKHAGYLTAICVWARVCLFQQSLSSVLYQFLECYAWE